MPKTILITGVAGFLGSHLCDRLTSNGDHVIGLDDLSTGNLGNLKSFYSNRLLFVNGDVRKLYAHIPPNQKIDEIYHLACPASPPKYQLDPVSTLTTCFNGTLSVLNLACERQSKILITSTSEIYGDPLEHPQKESYRGNVSTMGPRACYDEGKRVAESLVDAFHTKYNLQTRIARLFNTFGPRMSEDDGRLITNLIKAKKNGQPLPIYGDGTQTRTLNWVDYTIEGLIGLMNCQEANNQPINIGGEVELTILDIAKSIGADLEFLPLPINDPTKRKPDLTLAKKLFGYNPDRDPLSHITQLL